MSTILRAFYINRAFVCCFRCLFDGFFFYCMRAFVAFDSCYSMLSCSSCSYGVLDFNWIASVVGVLFVVLF